MGEGLLQTHQIHRVHEKVWEEVEMKKPLNHWHDYKTRRNGDVERIEGANCGDGMHYVRPYTKKDGTIVEGHCAKNPKYI